jgi:hypothetical protein
LLLEELNKANVSRPLSEPLHQKLIILYKKFLIVGGKYAKFVFVLKRKKLAQGFRLSLENFSRMEQIRILPVYAVNNLSVWLKVIINPSFAPVDKLLLYLVKLARKALICLIFLVV